MKITIESNDENIIEVAMIKDADDNCISDLFSTIGEAQRWAFSHNITGDNGEYIWYGTFDTEWRCEIETIDYAEIDPFYAT